MSSGQATKPASGLGSLISEHKPRRGVMTLFGLITVAGLVSGLAVGLYGVWRWYYGFSHYGPAVVWLWSSNYLLTGLCLLLVGLVGLIPALRLSGSAVRTYRQGMSYGKGHKRHFVRWSQIRRIFTSGVVYDLPGFGIPRSALVMYTDEGRVLRLTSALSDLPQLTRTIKRSVYPALLEEYKGMLRSLQTVQFGPWSLSTRGVVTGKQEIPWEDIDRVALDRGQLQVYATSAGKKVRLRVAVEKVPNVELCSHIIRNLMPSQ